MPGETSGQEAAGEELLRRYQAVRALTAAMREAAERDNTERLTQLVDERAAELAAAERTLAQTGGAMAGLAPTLRDRITGELRQAIDDDARLRALVASRASEVPQLLAALNTARAPLGGYHAGGGEPGVVDRRG